MTEDDAKTKWCPFSRVAIYPPDTLPISSPAQKHPCGHNRMMSIHGPDAAPATLCFGSKCMAWRWRYAHNGYCGLAGDID